VIVETETIKKKLKKHGWLWQVAELQPAAVWQKGVEHNILNKDAPPKYILG
jgi:hypothetical protein